MVGLHCEGGQRGRTAAVVETCCTFDPDCLMDPFPQVMAHKEGVRSSECAEEKMKERGFHLRQIEEDGEVKREE